MKTIMCFICISFCILASACVLSKRIKDEPCLFSGTNTSDLLCKIESQEVARLLIALAQIHHPYIDFKKAEKKDVLDFIEYLLMPGFDLSAIQHPFLDYKSINNTQYVTFHAEWASYLKILCCLSEKMKLYLCVSRDGKVLKFTEKSNLKDVYYICIHKSGDLSDVVYEVRRL